MSTPKSSVDLANISPVVKKAAKEWIKEALATNEAAGHFGSSEDLNERVTEVLMKEHNGKDPDFVKQKLDEIKPQVDFVVSLFNYINDELKNKQREIKLDVDLLAERLKRLLMALQTSGHADMVNVTFGSTAYPLSEEMADLFLSLNEKGIRSWDEMQKEEMSYMVKEYFILRGRKLIPWGWDFLRCILASSEGEFDKHIKAIRSRFASLEDADDFLNGKDFNYGLMDVRDEEFEAALGSLLEEVKSLAQAGALETGKALCPKDPPNLFMSSIPLIEGSWIDKKALTVLEWYRTISDMGYAMCRPEGENPLAWPIVLDETAQDEDVYCDEIIRVGGLGILSKDEQYSIFSDVEEHIKSLKLQERLIDGRTYVSMKGYFNRDGHLLKLEDFDIKEGITIRSWNSWFEEHGGEETACIGQFLVSEMSYDIKSYDIQRIPSLEDVFELQEMREKCNFLANKLKVSSSDSTPLELKEKGIEDGLYINPCPLEDQPIRASIAKWRDSAFDALVRYFALHMTILLIFGKLLDEEKIVFKDLEDTLMQAIMHIIALVFSYNDIIAEYLDKVKTVKGLTWSDTPPYGWGALFPNGFLIDMSDIQEAAEENYMSHFERYIKTAHD